MILKLKRVTCNFVTYLHFVKFLFRSRGREKNKGIRIFYYFIYIYDILYILYYV